jgi:hypothetical protein
MIREIEMLDLPEIEGVNWSRFPQERKQLERDRKSLGMELDWLSATLLCSLFDVLERNMHEVPEMRDTIVTIRGQVAPQLEQPCVVLVLPLRLAWSLVLLLQYTSRLKAFPQSVKDSFFKDISDLVRDAISAYPTMQALLDVGWDVSLYHLEVNAG